MINKERTLKIDKRLSEGEKILQKLVDPYITDSGIFGDLFSKKLNELKKNGLDIKYSNITLFDQLYISKHETVYYSNLIERIYEMNTDSKNRIILGYTIQFKGTERKNTDVLATVDEVVDYLYSFLEKTTYVAFTFDW